MIDKSIPAPPEEDDESSTPQDGLMDTAEERRFRYDEKRRGQVGRLVGDSEHAPGNIAAVAVAWLLVLLTAGMYFEPHRSETLEVVKVVFSAMIGFIAGSRAKR